jgi:hypothetical protein
LVHISGKEHRSVFPVVFQQQVPDKLQRYFPKDSIRTLANEAEERYIKQWAFEILFSFHEPVLYQYSGNLEVLRLTILISFGYAVVIRVNKITNTIFMSIKEFDKLHNRLNLDTTVQVSEAQWESIRSELDKTNFWTTVTSDTSETGKDGISYFLEAYIGKYYFISRWDGGRMYSGALTLHAKTLKEISKKIIFGC